MGDNGDLFRGLRVIEQPTEGGTSGTEDAEEGLISSMRIEQGEGDMHTLGDEGMGDSCETGGTDTVHNAMSQDADEDGVGVSSAKQSSWTRR